MDVRRLWGLLVYPITKLIDNFSKLIVWQAVVDMRSLPLTSYQTGLSQNTQMKRNIGLTQTGILDDVGDRPTLQPKTRHNKQSIRFSKYFQYLAKAVDIFFVVCVNAHMR